MLIKVTSVSFSGLPTIKIDVEVNIGYNRTAAVESAEAIKRTNSLYDEIFHYIFKGVFEKNQTSEELQKRFKEAFEEAKKESLSQ